MATTLLSFESLDIGFQLLYGSIPPVTIPHRHPPPRGICHFFLLGRLFPTPGHAARGNFPPPRLSIGQPLLSRTEERETTQLFVYKIKKTIFISVQNHTINIPETRALDNTSIPKISLILTLAFPTLSDA